MEQLVTGVRADTAGFARDVDTMRTSLQGPLGAGAAVAGQSIETALTRAVKTGKLGFDDLRTSALAAMDAIAAGAVNGGLAAVFGGSASGASGGGLLAGLAGLLNGAPGRATGGPVSPGRAYTVGERGPELFVPTSSGSVVAGGAGAGPRDVRVAITVQGGGSDAPGTLQRSSRQVARAVKAALQG